MSVGARGRLQHARELLLVYVLRMSIASRITARISKHVRNILRICIMYVSEPYPFSKIQVSLLKTNAHVSVGARGRLQHARELLLRGGAQRQDTELN